MHVEHCSFHCNMSINLGTVQRNLSQMYWCTTKGLRYLNTRAQFTFTTCLGWVFFFHLPGVTLCQCLPGIWIKQPFSGMFFPVLNACSCCRIQPLPPSSSVGTESHMCHTLGWLALSMYMISAVGLYPMAQC